MKNTRTFYEIISSILENIFCKGFIYHIAEVLTKDLDIDGYRCWCCSFWRGLAIGAALIIIGGLVVIGFPFWLITIPFSFGSVVIFLAWVYYDAYLRRV